MSPSWPRPRLAVHPERLALSVGRQVRDLPVRAQDGDSLAHAISGLLEDLPLRGGIHVVLSHHLAPVWLLPPPAVRLSWVETRGWIRDHLGKQYGDQVDRWRLTWQPTPPGSPVLAGALDEAWLATLDEILTAKRLHAVAVEPWLAAATNRRRRNLGRNPAWLALAEPGRITVAHFAAGEIKAARSLPAGDDMAAALADAIRRETLLAGLPEEAPVWLETAGVDADWIDATGLDVRQLGQRPGSAAALIGA